MFHGQGYGPSHDRWHAKQVEDWDLPDSGVTDLREVSGLLGLKISNKYTLRNLYLSRCGGYYLAFFITSQSVFWTFGCGYVFRTGCFWFLLFVLRHGFLAFLTVGGWTAGCRIMWAQRPQMMKSRTLCWKSFVVNVIASGSGCGRQRRYAFCLDVANSTKMNGGRESTPNNANSFGWNY